MVHKGLQATETPGATEMSEDWWLVKSILWIDVGVIVLVAICLYCTFPGKLREGAQRNAIRLDGSFSKRREKRETEARYIWLGNVMVTALACLLLLNGIVYAIHRLVLPLPLAAAAFEKFDADKDAWRVNLADPQQGNLIREFDEWQAQQGRSASAAIPLTRMLPLLLIAGVAGLALLLTLLVLLARCYVHSLLRLQEGIQKRHRDYLQHDMHSRWRAVEALNSGSSANRQHV
jgi:hypothetical protein